jgi:phosphonate C-P lyase system protein PhnG
MTRWEWISVLAQARPETIAELAGRLASAPRAETIRPPAPGLLLAMVEESVEGGGFHPGEILVTACEVRLDGVLGQAVILGGDEKKALGCALLDAALQGGVPEQGEILATLVAEQEWLCLRRQAEQEMIQATRVHFETMDPQRV